MKLAFALFLLTMAMEAQQYRAFWADAFHSGFKTPAEIELLLEDAKAARANAVFVQMRRRGDGYFLRSLEPAASDPNYSPSFDALDYLCRRAHERGIEVHAWMVVLPSWRENLGTPPDARHVWNAHGPKARNRDMWMTVNNRGEVSYSVDPGHPEAARHVIDAVIEPVRQYPIDGVHLDYIRYPEYEGDWGRNPRALERFRTLYGRTGSPDAGDPQWNEFRRTQVTALMRQIYIRAHAIRPNIKVSASVITWGNGPADLADFSHSRAFAQVHQDWPSWLAEGILDLAVPMNYFVENKTAAWLDRWLEFQKDNQAGRLILPGLGAYLNPVEQTLAQARRALAPSAAGNRLPGFAFYSYAATNSASIPTIEFYRELSASFTDPGKVPPMPWLEKPVGATVYGWLTVNPETVALADGATVLIESAGSGQGPQVTTDGTGFFGAVGVAPGRYRVRVERGGREVFRTAAREVSAGESALFHIFLQEADFRRVAPTSAGSNRRGQAPLSRAPAAR
ncbi:MAG TPA: family 10 glycosylhydrolase [Bryobacteraceae bacterium]|nr:family 10 glycosylhydrolase [Bryobacteraceae bacterium]